MSLNTDERLRTGEELRSNLALSGLTADEAAADLGFAPERLRGVLAVDPGVDPVDVWQLRDYLEHAVRDAGGEPTPYSVLTARSRVMARAWYRLREAPRHDFGRP